MILKILMILHFSTIFITDSVSARWHQFLISLELQKGESVYKHCTVHNRTQVWNQTTQQNKLEAKNKHRLEFAVDIWYVARLSCFVCLSKLQELNKSWVETVCKKSRSVSVCRIEAGSVV